MKDLFVDVDGVMTKVNMKEVTFMPTFKGAEKFVFDDNGKIISITDEEQTRLGKLMQEHFNYCGDTYPDSSLSVCKDIMRRTVEAKADILNGMVIHPNWNGDYALEWSGISVHRSIDKEGYIDFLDNAYKYTKALRVPLEFEGLKYSTICFMYNEYENQIYHAESIKEGFEIVQQYIDDQTEKLEKMKSLKDMVTDKWANGEVHKANGEVYDENEYMKLEKARCIFSYLQNRIVQFISKETEDYINYRFPDFKAKEGQKTSRVVNKLCKMIGLDKITWEWLYNKEFEIPAGCDMNANAYNYKFAKFADTCNPFDVDKHLFISVHPVEAFLAMSWGTDWATCMVTDKDNMHGWVPSSGASYHGMYSGGVMSYMLDRATVTMYILGKDAEEKAIRNNEPSPRKEMRQLFHIGKEKFIQGRLYPNDQTDKGRNAEPEEYTQYREIMQSALSIMWNVPNLWLPNKRGSNACREWEITRGCHYADYECYSNPNISLLKDYTNTDKIEIGAKSICPSCGRMHTTSDNCFCEDCTEEGEWCEYHECYEHEDLYYVDGYGSVCESALYDSGDFTRCDHCDEWVYTGGYDDNGVCSNRDERFFCCERCAERAGYYWSDHYDDWLSEDDTYYSEIDDIDLLEDDDDTCWAYYNEYGDTTIALKESCYYINGEWYDANLCVETVNGNYVPEWEAVDIDGEIYEKDELIEYEDDYYLPSRCVDVDGILTPIDMTEMYIVDRMTA